MLIESLVWGVALAAIASFLFIRTRRYLHLFQQDEYDSARFAPWLIRTYSFDKKLSAILLAVLALDFFFLRLDSAWVWAVAGLVMAGYVAREPNPLKGGKKPLVLTVRAREILGVAILLGIGAVAALMALNAPWGVVLIAQAPPFALMAAVLILSPHERGRQNFYRRQAEQRLADINPRIIGITGSFGKTTTKHLLGHMLAMVDQAYITPGSTNTVMGNVRLIREKLPADCRNFVVEMGAYGPGSIGRLCELTPPDCAIITAIGEAHYERFKSLDAVARTKFELAEAVLKKPSGVIVIHEGVLDQPYARAVVEKNRARFIICGEGEMCDWIITRIDQTADGLRLTLRMRGAPHDIILSAPLFGVYAASNMALAYVMGRALGYDSDHLVQAFRTAPQTRHRLEVIRHPDDSIVIDDAYNSNPRGFQAALDILSVLARDGQRTRILVTPGMVELGERHDALHAELGRIAAQHCDIAIIVQAQRIPTFVDQFRATAPDKPLYEVTSFAQAQDWLNQHKPRGAVILLENDLPDLYERRLDV